MKAFYSLYGSSQVRRLHILREGRQRPRPKWRSDRPPTPEGWCGTAGWDCSDGAGRQVIDPMPTVPPPHLTWCPTCIGRVLEELGLLPEVAELVSRRVADTPAA